MPEETKEPTNAELLVALQGVWRQQRDLVQGVENRLSTKIDGVEKRLDAKIDTKFDTAEERLDQKLSVTEARLDQKITLAEKRLGERVAQEIKDRPIVVHVDMSRVSVLEKEVLDLTRRVEDLEGRG
jgi:hypothetical protein